MRYLFEKAGFVIRLAALSLLLAAQSLSLAHEVGHAGAGDASLCAVCSMSTGLDTAILFEHAVPDTRPALQVEYARPGLTTLKVIATPLAARAPPHAC